MDTDTTTTERRARQEVRQAIEDSSTECMGRAVRVETVTERRMRHEEGSLVFAPRAECGAVG